MLQSLPLPLASAPTAHLLEKVRSQCGVFGADLLPEAPRPDDDVSVHVCELVLDDAHVAGPPHYMHAGASGRQLS